MGNQKEGYLPQPQPPLPHDPLSSFFDVSMENGRYAGQKRNRDVARSTTPISPNQLLKITPKIMTATPAIARSILSVFPTLHFIANSLF